MPHKTTQFLLLVCVLPLAYVTALPCDAGYTWSGTVCTGTFTATVKSVSSTGYTSGHACAIWAPGAGTNRLTCWGKNTGGELGIGNTNNIGDGANEMGTNLVSVALPTDRYATSVGAGDAHTCTVVDNGNVYCWGTSTYGALGRGDTTVIGDGAGEMGNALVAAQLPNGLSATKVSCGSDFTCVILSNGKVTCWGKNDKNQLGNGNANTIGDGANEMGNNLVYVHMPDGYVAVDLSCSAANACAVTSDGLVYCWGSNTYGQLGIEVATTARQGGGAGVLLAVKLPVAFTSATKVSCASNHMCALTNSGQVGCWGRNSEGQLGRGTTAHVGADTTPMSVLSPISLRTGTTAIDLSAYGGHACAVQSDHKIVCWGTGGWAQLGNVATTNIGDAAGEMGDALMVVALPTGLTANSVSVGYSYSFGVLSDGRIGCWGSNGVGILGLGISGGIRGDTSDEVGNGLTRISLPTASVSTCSAGAHYTGAECTLCVEGAYTTTTNVLGSAYDCTKCSAGTFSVTTGATLASTCGNCAAGTFSTASGAAACVNCGAGTFSTASGAALGSTCTNCGAGTFSTASGAALGSTCADCGIDTYAANAGAVACTDCPEGTHSAATAATSAEVCVAPTPDTTTAAPTTTPAPTPPPTPPPPSCVHRDRRRR